MANHKLRIRDNQEIVEVYGNKLVSTFFDGAALTITVGNTRFVPDKIDEPPKQGQHPEIYITSRLALSPSAAVELVNALNNMLSALSQAHQTQQQAGSIKH